MRKLFCFIVSLLFFQLSGCGLSNNADQDGTGRITGTTVTTNNLTKETEDVVESESFIAYLYDIEDGYSLVDSNVVEENRFEFNEVPFGLYDVVVQGQTKGGTNKQVEVNSTEVVKIEVVIEIYITQVFVIDQSVTNITVINGAAGLQEGELNLSAVPGDTLRFVLEYEEDGVLLQVPYFATLSEEGEWIVLPFEENDESDLVEPFSSEEEVLSSQGVSSSSSALSSEESSSSDEGQSTLSEQTDIEIVADYNFELSSDLLYDSGPNGLSGSVVSGTGISKDENFDWLALDAGANYSLSMPSMDSLLDLNDFSIAVVFQPAEYPSNSSGEAAVCGASFWEYGVETYGYEIKITDEGYIEFILGQSESYSWTILQSESSVAVGEWVSVTVRYQDGIASLFVDEQPPVSLSSVPAVASIELPLDIGFRSVATPRNQFSGLIDRITFYNGPKLHEMASF
jgi:hypothetical protein